jgi:hypothetical protein
MGDGGLFDSSFHDCMALAILVPVKNSRNAFIHRKKNIPK